MNTPDDHDQSPEHEQGLREELSDGGPAFPMALNETTSSCSPVGMSLRDYFAGKALEGFAFLKVYSQSDPCANSHEELARCSYQIADAMLAERDRKQ